MKNKNYELTDLGYDTNLNEFRVDHQLEDLSVGRVILEHRERYIVLNDDGEFEQLECKNRARSLRSP